MTSLFFNISQWRADALKNFWNYDEVMTDRHRFERIFESHVETVRIAVCTCFLWFSQWISAWTPQSSYLITLKSKPKNSVSFCSSVCQYNSRKVANARRKLFFIFIALDIVNKPKLFTFSWSKLETLLRSI